MLGACSYLTEFNESTWIEKIESFRCFRMWILLFFQLIERDEPITSKKKKKNISKWFLCLDLSSDLFFEWWTNIIHCCYFSLRRISFCLVKHHWNGNDGIFTRMFTNYQCQFDWNVNVFFVDFCFFLFRAIRGLKNYRCFDDANEWYMKENPLFTPLCYLLCLTPHIHTHKAYLLQ